MVDLEDDAYMAEEVPSKKTGGVQTRRSQIQEQSEQPPAQPRSKRMRIDDEQDVADLLQKSMTVSQRPEILFDMPTKRYLYKLMSEVT